MVEPTTVEDTVQTDAQNQTDGATVEGTEQAENEGLLFGKYKSQDDVAKALHEKDTMISRQGEETARMRERLATIEREAELTKAIGRLADAQKSTSEPKAPSLDEYVSQIGREFSQDPVKATKDLSEMLGYWQSQGEMKLREEIEKSKREIFADLEGVKTTQIKSSPEYQRHKTLVEKLTGEGMPLTKAINFASDISKLYPQIQERETPPASIATNRKTASGKQSYLSPDEREGFVQQFGEDVVKQMEADYQRQMSR